MPETKIATGIAAQQHNCWELIYPKTGMLVETSDGTRHFDSRSAAEAWADGMRDDGKPGADELELREMGSPCWIVAAGCGWRLDDEVPMVMHHESAEEAQRAAIDAGMGFAPNGALICDPNCDDCKHAATATGSDPSQAQECQ